MVCMYIIESESDIIVSKSYRSEYSDIIGYTCIHVYICIYFNNQCEYIKYMYKNDGIISVSLVLILV